MAKRTFMVYEIVTCPQCDGEKIVHEHIKNQDFGGWGVMHALQEIDCPKCGGTGNVYAPVDLAEALKAFMVDVYHNADTINHVAGHGEIVQKDGGQ